MEKPVRIIENEKMRTFNEKVRNGLEHALNFMLSASEAGGKIQISFFEPFLMPIEAYIQAYRKSSILIKIHSDHDYQGELYWFFETKTAIILGSLLRMLPVNALEEKIAKADFDAGDQDAFGEVGNQLCGILDRAFRSLTNKNIHLKMDFKKTVYPHESIKPESFRRDQEYVVLLSAITLPNQGSQKLTLLLPRSLYEVMLNLEVALEGIIPRRVLLYSADGALTDRLQTEMNSRHTKVVVMEKPDDVITMIDQSSVTAIGMEVPRPSFPLQHQDNIFFKRLATNRIFTRTPYFLTWKDATAAEVEQVTKLGLGGATAGSMEKDFPRWALSFTQDPSSPPRP